MAEPKIYRVKVGETIVIGPEEEAPPAVPPGALEIPTFVLQPIEPMLPPEEVPPPALPPEEEVPYVPPPIPPPIEVPLPAPPVEEVYNPYLYPTFKREIVPSAPIPTDRPLIIDIETTGSKPWESRLICIGLKDPQKLEEKPLIIMHEDEVEMLKYFFKYLKINGYNALIGYNIAFDFRYLFVRAMLFRIPCMEFTEVKLHDVMQILGQVKEAFVYGKIPNTNLDTWAKFLLDMKKTMTNAELLTAYRTNQWDKIMEYNANDVEITFLLWVLIEYTRRTPFPTEGSASMSTSSAGGSVKCKLCMAEVTPTSGPEGNKCPICGTSL